MTGISHELEQELRRALKLRQLPSSFADAIAVVLHMRNSTKLSNQDAVREREAVERIVMAGATLQAAIAHANAVYANSRSPWPPRDVMVSPEERSRFIGNTWYRVSEPLDHMEDRLKSWLTAWPPPVRRRGNPGRLSLRHGTFNALADAGVHISNNAQGTAAKVLRVVLEEADRLDGKSSRPRANFNGTQWAGWVDAYVKSVERAETFLRTYKESGGLRALFGKNHSSAGK